jgi:N-acylneuraminate cytidylyltransferase
MVASDLASAIIPARGGSKSIERKNVRSFAGHPLLAYSIAAGRQSAAIERVIVSTDDEEIAQIARDYGAEVPFLRPPELAKDDTPDFPVFKHALEWLERAQGYQPGIVVQLRPTSPLRPPDLVDRAVALLAERRGADSVRGVVPSGQNPYKMWRVDPDRRMHPLLTDGPAQAFNQPRQALPATYWQTGHIDAIRWDRVKEGSSLSGEVIVALEIDPRYAVDIDTERDWRRAEMIAREAEFAYVHPNGPRRELPDEIKLLVLDFDGVLTDNRVWVDGSGREQVAANRGDGWGIGRVREKGVEVIVISTESDPVVAARCEKLGIEAHQGIVDKVPALMEILSEKGVEPERAVFVGNDVNDVPCFRVVGFAFAPSDAQREARHAADCVLEKAGGHGAVREVCDILLRDLS